MSIICAFQFNVEVERGALRSLIGGMSNRFPGNRVSRDRPVLPQLPLRRQNGSKLCFKGIPRVAAVASIEDTRRGGGTPLAEVYAVTINNIDDESPGDLYGTVKVKDQENTQTIYNSKRDDAGFIYPDQNALLIGPNTQAILASESFYIDVNLFDRQSGSSSDDKQVSKGQISWSVNNSTNIYDEPIPHKIDGSNGSATVVYAVLKDAVQASVEVTMMIGNSKDQVDVYGDITASNTKTTTKFESVLFRITQPAHVSVITGKVIPLTRSIVPVPLNSQFTVCAKLSDYDTEESIANGTAKFPVQLSGTSTKKIYGEFGMIQVQVTWKKII